MLKHLRSVICIILILASAILMFSCGEKETEEGGAVYYKVTFNSDGGTHVDERQIAKGKTITEPPAPTKDGYIFGGWYKVDDNGMATGAWSFDYDTVKSDTTLKAKWLLPDGVFNFEPNGDGETATITGVKGGIGGLITNITLPEAIGGYKVTTVSEGAFSRLSSEDFISITLPECITVIEAEAFSGSKDIKIAVKGQLTFVGEKAFYECTGLTEVGFADGIEVITAEAFSGCSSLAAVRLPKSVKVIEENAFDSCTSLLSVMLHTDIESIENMAFDEAGLKTVYFYGTNAEISELLENKIDFGNDAFNDATILVYSEEEPTAASAYDGFWYLDKNDKIKLWK